MISKGTSECFVYIMLPGETKSVTAGKLQLTSNQNLLSQCSRFLLDRTEAEQMISAMQDQVKSTWYKVVRSCGVNEKDAETIRRAFAYEGFAR